jgi:hypothetical protein
MIKRKIISKLTPSGQRMAISVRLLRTGVFTRSVCHEKNNVEKWWDWGIAQEHGESVWSLPPEKRKVMGAALYSKYGTDEEYRTLCNEIISELVISASQVNDPRNKVKVMETLNFSRIATEKEDGTSGFVFIHNWATGWQELIFSTAIDAAAWIKKVNAA